VIGSLLALLTIEIGIDPTIGEVAGLLLTWHGVFTALGIGAGVWAAVVVGRRLGFIDDDIYSAALIAIPFGIVGARGLFVVERWGTSGVDDVIDIFRLNEGGISIYGAVLGGFLGGLIYGWFRRLPLRRGLDVAAVGLVLGMGIGRIGDIINGEHFAKVSSLPWAVRYTHLDSPSAVAHPACDQFDIATGKLLCAYHPAVAYEMLGDFLIFGLLLLAILFVKRDGVAFFGFLLLYSLMRFGVSELRIDSREIIAGLTTPQVTALFIIPPALLGLLYSLRSPESEAPATGRAVPVPATGPPVR
jgi:phosphatidylglycerol:prolipoprotein diacylglycerol transferase